MFAATNVQQTICIVWISGNAFLARGAIPDHVDFGSEDAASSRSAERRRNFLPVYSTVLEGVSQSLGGARLLGEDAVRRNSTALRYRTAVGSFHHWLVVLRVLFFFGFGRRHEATWTQLR